VTGIAPDTLVDGRYRILRKLGSGGMADVYLAQDTQLERRVAIKLLARRFAEDPAFVERFRREASNAAGLSHPGLVAIYDRGRWDGTYYIAMEYLPGLTLKELIRERGALAPAEATDIAIQMLQAVRYAHRHGIVHRDIKPQNVMIDEEGRAKVTDFGIARAGSSDMTETGSILGTAQYLSPEQAQGLPVDGRADLYAVGVVLYELLSGRVPFDAESAVTVALKHVSERPTPPGRIAPGVPPALESVVMQALEKRPDDRFQDADAFIAALEAARDRPAAGRRRAVPVEPPPPPRPAPPGPPTAGEAVAALADHDRRGRRRLVIAALVILLAAGIGVAAFLLTRAEQVRVPDVTGKRGETATKSLEARGFTVRVLTVRSDDVTRNRVVSQDPDGGAQADEGSTVTLTISDGPGDAPVPDVTGRTTADAEAALQDAGFAAKVRRAYSDSVEEGHVISSNPSAGSVARRKSTVTITVSRGTEPATVPDVTGKSRSDAEAALTAAGLDAAVTEKETGDEDPGTVLSQGTPAGTEVARGTAVDLVVAKAPPDVDVPDVSGQPVDAARRTLKSAGFDVSVDETDVDDPAQDGVVQEQDPVPGGKAPKGTPVLLLVGRYATRGPEPTPTPSPTVAPSPTATVPPA
jgi:serine/threonine-protein kinase